MLLNNFLDYQSNQRSCQKCYPDFKDEFQFEQDLKNLWNQQNLNGYGYGTCQVSPLCRESDGFTTYFKLSFMSYHALTKRPTPKEFGVLGFIFPSQISIHSQLNPKKWLSSRIDYILLAYRNLLLPPDLQTLWFQDGHQQNIEITKPKL